MQYRTINGFSKYRIYPNGMIHNGTRFINGTVSPKGYIRHRLSDDNCKPKAFLLHRLIAIAYIPNPNNLPQINHIDGDKLNNTVSNLEWCDNDHNQRHAVMMGLKGSPKGETHPSAKLTQNTVEMIRRDRAINGLTYWQLAHKYSISKSSIGYIITKRNWKLETLKQNA